MASQHGVEHGQWFWHELATPDPDGAAAFYKAVLGWESGRDDTMPNAVDYRLFKQDGANAGGVMPMKGPMWAGIAPHWLIYIAVADVDAAKAAVEANGGTVKYGPFDAPGVGRMLVCQDPAGAHFALCEPAAEMRAPEIGGG